MANKIKELRLELVHRIIQYIYEKLPPKEAELLDRFVQRYLLSASPEDLASRSVIDLYGAILSHWHFINQRKPGESKVRVYNPQFEEHGWQSTHTVIEIAHDEMPFLVDSIRMELEKRGLSVHLILHLTDIKFVRDEAGHIQEILTKEQAAHTDIKPDTAIFIEIDRQSNVVVLQAIKEALLTVLDDVSKAVRDWFRMSETMNSAIAVLEKEKKLHLDQDFDEKIEFLRWINDNHFTYIGYYELKIVPTETDKEWHVVEHSGMGVLSGKSDTVVRVLSTLPLAAQQWVMSSDPIMMGKTKTIATIHRPVYSDFISVKIFNAKGEVTGEHRFIGLYTSAAYNRSPEHIPWLRQKVKNILKRACVDPESHEGKTLLNILHTIPRDDFIQGEEASLHDIGMGIFYLQERQKIRLFVRQDTFGRFVSCLTFVPRDRFNSELRQRLQNLLQAELHGDESSFVTRFTESVLARIHFTIRFNQYTNIEYDLDVIQQKLIEIARTWQENLQDALIDHCGEELGNRLYEDYAEAFPSGYREDFPVRTAVYDILHMETVRSEKPLAMSFYRPIEAQEDILRFKLFGENQSLALSDVIPMLEFMGLRVIGERPHQIRRKDKKDLWITDFTLVHTSGAALNAVALKDVFQETFYNVWMGLAESDGFNCLVLGVGLNWREISMLRAYFKYMWQIGFTFSQSYVEEALASNPIITQQLVELFTLRFDPVLPQEDKNTRTLALRRKIKQDLEEVSNLDEDRILRRYVDVILGSIRTNYYQLDSNGNAKSYISFKFDSAAISDMPLPRPMFEIFVYSPRVEGVHLRGAKVARGGIRWSDRKEDYRTEVLGLMKAQQVKNAVIVPLGAKGGFIPKYLPENGDRESIYKEVVASYRIFISGLLDLTDNLQGNEVIPPANVVRYDADDPYLVVAADKGTATFSDIANALSEDYHFWLGDAFASGGSSGYDHKKIAITARGAWESVIRHFREMKIDVSQTEISVVGIGDMSGDVFGNGLLLSKKVKLVAAFDHRHIFLDPSPDPAKSFEERQRLFELPRSSWDDYNKKLISQGGGVYPRSAKNIDLSKEMQEILDIQRDRIVPNELIRAILKAPVDLLWNGGIGTYVKASYEHNTEVGDRTNDSVRINGEELRAKVVGEGGNLGFTQLGRVEYALAGGNCNTDAIDNSAGVDCSDHEVNIKILLNGIEAVGDITRKQRNQLLAEMTEEVSSLVLINNIRQTAILSMAVALAVKNIDIHRRLMQYLETNSNLVRKLEYLPTEEMLNIRKQNKQGLTRPELAVLLAYSKTYLKQSLLATDLPEDPYILKSLVLPFPIILRQKYLPHMKEHRLKREIIVMQIVNDILYEMGLGFLNRIQDETGAHPDTIVRAYVVANEVFKGSQFREAIESLDFIIDYHTQASMFLELVRLLRRATRWFIRHRTGKMDIEKTIHHFQPLVQRVSIEVRKYLRGTLEEKLQTDAQTLIAADVPSEFAYRISSLSHMFSALDIVESATVHDFDLERATAVYYTMGARLEIGWFRDAIDNHPVNNHWEALARAAFRDDLDRQQRALMINILHIAGAPSEIDAKMDAWMSHHQILVDRWKNMVHDLQATPVRDMIMYSVAMRELADLAQANGFAGNGNGDVVIVPHAAAP